MLMRAISGHIAVDDPPAIAEAVLAAMGRRRAHSARRRPRPSPPRPPSMCFTSIDILAVGVDVFEVAAASTREHHCDDDHSSDCGQHPVGQPFSQHRGRAMAFCTPTQPAGGPQGHRTGRRPQTGAPAGYFCNKPKRCRLRKRESVKLIFSPGRMDTTAEASPPLNTDVSRRIGGSSHR